MTDLTEPQLAALLPGTWLVGATNFPMWIRGDRLTPAFSYELLKESPLRLLDTVSYFTTNGVEKRIVGVDRFSGGSFTWRGRGILRLFSSRWSVAGVDSAGRFAVIRFARSIATPAGVDIVVPQGTEAHELRAWVAADTAAVGITDEEFASLSWLAVGSN